MLWEMILYLYCVYSCISGIEFRWFNFKIATLFTVTYHLFDLLLSREESLQEKSSSLIFSTVTTLGVAETGGPCPLV